MTEYFDSSNLKNSNFFLCPLNRIVTAVFFSVLYTTHRKLYYLVLYIIVVTLEVIKIFMCFNKFAKFIYTTIVNNKFNFSSIIDNF